jgi:uncharacterized protein (TIGR02284 family)
MQKNHKIARLLNHVIKADRDLCEEFKEASSDMEMAAAKIALVEFARDGQSRVLELQAIIDSLGENAGTDRLGGWLHRRWMGMRNLFDQPDDSVTLGYCLTYLEVAIDAYLNALEHHLPSAVRPVVERQFSDICAEYDTLDLVQHAGNWYTFESENEHLRRSA